LVKGKLGRSEWKSLTRTGPITGTTSTKENIMKTLLPSERSKIDKLITNDAVNCPYCLSKKKLIRAMWYHRVSSELWEYRCVSCGNTFESKKLLKGDYGKWEW
jgi:DNA-directed RNA polymerase subunit RPC12/RpoP